MVDDLANSHDRPSLLKPSAGLLFESIHSTQMRRFMRSGKMWMVSMRTLASGALVTPLITAATADSLSTNKSKSESVSCARH